MTLTFVGETINRKLIISSGSFVERPASNHDIVLIVSKLRPCLVSDHVEPTVPIVHPDSAQCLLGKDIFDETKRTNINLSPQ